MICVQCFGRGKLRERDNLKDVGINGMIILEVILNFCGECELD